MSKSCGGGPKRSKTCRITRWPGLHRNPILRQLHQRRGASVLPASISRQSPYGRPGGEGLTNYTLAMISHLLASGNAKRAIANSQLCAPCFSQTRRLNLCAWCSAGPAPARHIRNLTSLSPSPLSVVCGLGK
jgi:hypothetical protein